MFIISLVWHFLSFSHQNPIRLTRRVLVSFRSNCFRQHTLDLFGRKSFEVKNLDVDVLRSCYRIKLRTNSRQSRGHRWHFQPSDWPVVRCRVPDDLSDWREFDRVTRAQDVDTASRIINNFESRYITKNILCTAELLLPWNWVSQFDST